MMNKRRMYSLEKNAGTRALLAAVNDVLTGEKTGEDGGASVSQRVRMALRFVLRTWDIVQVHFPEWTRETGRLAVALVDYDDLESIAGANFQIERTTETADALDTLAALLVGPVNAEDVTNTYIIKTALRYTVLNWKRVNEQFPEWKNTQYEKEGV